jgi:hypothetical protein
MNSPLIRRMAVVVFFVGAALPAFAQNPGGNPAGGPPVNPAGGPTNASGDPIGSSPASTANIEVALRRVDQELKSAGTFVDDYIKSVRDYKAGKGVKAKSPASACEASFSAAAVFSVPAAEKAPYVDAGVQYQACMAISENAPVACGDLSKMDASGAAVATCRQIATNIRFLRSMRRQTADGRRACIDQLSSPEASKLFSGIPPDRLGAACDALATGKSKNEIIGVFRSLSPSGFSSEAIGDLSRTLDMYLTPGYKCQDCTKNLCCDTVATARAAREERASACGGSAYCRAAFEGSSKPCLPLLNKFSSSYCAAQSGEAGKTVVNPAVEALQKSYLDANRAVATTLQNAESLEPRSDPRMAERLEKARDLRSRLDKAPKWGVKGAGPKK